LHGQAIQADEELEDNLANETYLTYSMILLIFIKILLITILLIHNASKLNNPYPGEINHFYIFDFKLEVYK